MTSTGGPSYTPAQDSGIHAARKFTKYVEYDLSKIQDTKGGFLSVEDDPHNRALHAIKDGERPAHMTLKEWERHQLLRNLRQNKAGPFEPGMGPNRGAGEGQKCRECGGFEIDALWEEVFRCAVCSACKEKYPERYSLLTKTEAKDDYLITDREFSSPLSLVCECRSGGDGQVLTWSQ